MFAVFQSYFVDVDEQYRGKALIFTMTDRPGWEADIIQLYTTLISLEIDVQHVLDPTKEVGTDYLYRHFNIDIIPPYSSSVMINY